MNKSTHSPRIKISATAVAVFGFALGSTALAGNDLFDTYYVPPGKSNNAHHDNADYIVFKVPGADAGIFFIEKTGPFKFQPFYCDDATWSASDESVSCWRLVTFGPHAIKETVTVGTIGGPFCDDLREKHNPRGKPTKVITADECRGIENEAKEQDDEEAKCSCYEITHHCWGDSGYDRKCRAGLADDAKGSGSGDAAAPPGSGAGSGKAH